MEDERKVTMQLTEFEAECIGTIRRIQQKQNELMDWKGIIICSSEWHRELVREKIRWQTIAEEMEMEKETK